MSAEGPAGDATQQLRAGLSTAMGNRSQLISLQLQHQWYPFGATRLEILSGIRYNMMFDQQADFKCGSSCAQKLSIDPVSKNTQALNAMLGLQFNFSSFIAGFNIDFIGFSPVKREVNITQADSGGTIRGGAETPAVNVFKWAFQDRGTLNSEFFVGYKFDRNLTIRLGLTHYLVHFAPSDPAIADARYFFDMVFVNVSYGFLFFP